MHRPHPKSASQAARRRGPTLLALLAIAVLTVPGVLAGVRPDAPTLLDQMPDPTALDKLFRDYELQVMDPYLWREQLATGAVDVTLRGKSFHVLVEPAPWEASLRAASPSADGSWAYREDAFGSVAYLGAVPAEAGSHALFVVTGSGVYGYVRTAEENLRFEPAQFHVPLAPAGVSVVFRMEDAVRRANPSHEGTTALVPSEPGMPPADEMGASYNLPGPDRSIALFADDEARAHANYQYRITNIMSEVNANYLRLVGFKFNVMGNTVYDCPAAGCPASPLLYSFANYARTTSGPWTGFELAHLFTGKPAGGNLGEAYEPGRYAYTGFGGVDASAALIVAHELGHNFNARHARSNSYIHPHSDRPFHEHSTIMGNAGDVQWEFTSANANWIRACNARSWSEGSRVPRDTTGFTARCWTGESNHQNEPAATANDESNYQGKYFYFMTRGTVGRVCVTTGGPGNLILEARATPISQPLFQMEIVASGAGQYCDFGDYTWTHDSMFIYKAFGTASIAYDTTNADGWRSNDGGSTFAVDGRRRAIQVNILGDNIPLEPCGALASGATLARDRSITSCNARYRLTHQGDGNLVLYNATGGVTKVDWATHTAGATLTSLVMQTDGNLVLYSNGVPLWASNTAGQPGATLAVRDDGLLMVIGKGGATLWVEGCGLLGPNSKLLRGKEIRSCDRRSSLQHQTDGNVVLYRDGVYDSWATNTMGWATTEFKMQDDGNLVLYGQNGAVAWASDSPGNPDTWLRVQDDGKLILWTPRGAPICHKMKC